MTLDLIALAVIAFIIWAVFHKPRQKSGLPDPVIPQVKEQRRYFAQQYEDRSKQIVAKAAGKRIPSKPPARRITSPTITRAPKPTPITPFVSSPSPAPASSSSDDLLIGAAIGFGVASLLENDDRPASSPPAPDYSSGGGGDFGGGGASGSWDDNSSSSSSFSSDSSSSSFSSD